MSRQKNAAIAAFVSQLGANMVNTEPLRLFGNKHISGSGELRMASTASTLQLRPLMLLGGAGAILIVVTAGLWGWYGTTVFFEMVRTGWAACF
jgi:hypothetical protein